MITRYTEDFEFGIQLSLEPGAKWDLRSDQDGEVTVVVDHTYLRVNGTQVDVYVRVHTLEDSDDGWDLDLKTLIHMAQEREELPLDMYTVAETYPKVGT